MTMTDSVTHGPGHNQPPGEGDHYQSYLDELQRVITPAVGELSTLVRQQTSRVPETLDNEATACKAVELALKLGDLIDTIDIVVSQNKNPLDETVRLMRTNNAAWTDKAQALCDRVRGMLADYMDTLPEGQNLRTEYGSLAILARHLDFEVESPGQVPEELKSPDKAKIKAKIKEYADDPGLPGGKKLVELLNAVLPGIRVFEKPQLVLRDGRP